MRGWFVFALLLSGSAAAGESPANRGAAVVPAVAGVAAAPARSVASSDGADRARSSANRSNSADFIAAAALMLMVAGWLLTSYEPRFVKPLPAPRDLKQPGPAPDTL
jgi:hypothetical protein